MNDNKYFCYELHKNLAIWSKNGQIGYNPCSFFQGYFKTSDTLDLPQAWNSPERKKLLDLANNNQPVPGCEHCYRAEEQGLVSRRQQSFPIYEEWHQDTAIDLDGPSGIDYSVGNLCNLKCIICNPGNSSQWIPDYQKLYPTANLSLLKYQKNSQIEISDNAVLNNVITLHFHGGGEPLMSQAHVNLLERINDVKGLADVRVFYNTNGTIIPDDQVLRLWEQCKLVELYFSIDDINNRFEYQRTACKFDKLTSNLEWYTENMPHNHMFKVNTVWSYLNLYYLDSLVDWKINTFDSNRFGDPTELIFQEAGGPTGIEHISLELRDILMKKFEKYPELIKLITAINISTKSHDKFLNWISKLDAIRNQSFAQIAPEWHRLLNENTM